MQEPQAAPATSRSARSARFYNYLHRYKKLLQRRWWVLPLTLAAGMAVQGYRVWTAPPKFTAVGRMIVSPRVNIQTGPTVSEEYINFLGTQRELMKGAEVLERAAARVKQLKPNLPPVLVDLQVGVSPKTTIFNLQAVGSEPEYTRAYLDACMEEYMLLKQKMRGVASENTLQDLNASLVSLENDLKRLEAEEMNFKMSNSIIYIQEQGNSATKYLTQLNGKLAAKKTELEFITNLTLEQNLALQQKSDAATPTGAATDSPTDAARLLHNDYFKAKQDLQLKRNELAELSKDLKPKHPRIIALTDEIQRKEKLLEIYREQGQEELETRRSTLAVEIQTLGREIAFWESQAADTTAKIAAFDRITRDKQRAQSLYDRLLQNVQGIDMDRGINQETVSVLQRAKLVRPQNALIPALILGAVAGLLVGLVILVVVERLDDRPTSFTDLQEVFDEPVLGQIPLEHAATRKGGVALIHPTDKRHAFLEAYRNLRSSLLYMASEGKRPRVLVVTSAIPGDGKSMTAANFAITMAISGSRVLLVDADLRKGFLHRQFGHEPAPGLNEVLEGQTDWRGVVRTTSTANLSLIPRGNTARNPGEMFLSPVSLKLIKDLAAEYDFVIFDTAPVMAADDVTSLSPHVEGVIFVIRAGCTSGRVARAALDLLYQREVSVLGLVFNGVETNASEYYYYRYKDYYADHKHA